jgi:hypothetical protein
MSKLKKKILLKMIKSSTKKSNISGKYDQNLNQLIKVPNTLIPNSTQVDTNSKISDQPSNRTGKIITRTISNTHPNNKSLTLNKKFSRRSNKQSTDKMVKIKI